MICKTFDLTRCLSQDGYDFMAVMAFGMVEIGQDDLRNV